VSGLVVCLPRNLRVPFFESALARTRILVLNSFLTRGYIDFVGFTYLRKLELVEITARFLNFVDKVEDGFVVSVKIASDLSGSSSGDSSSSGRIHPVHAAVTSV